MAATEQNTYTAKLTDGPLEGTTIRTDFLETGDPRPRLEIPVESGAKRYLYSRGGGLEYEEGSQGGRPTAVEYRYLEAVFD